MIRASRLKGIPVVSTMNGRTGLSAVAPLVDITKKAVSHIGIRTEGIESAAGFIQLPIDQVDRLDTEAVEVRDINGQNLLSAKEEDLPGTPEPVNLIGMNVISRMGNLKGVVQDYLFSQHSGKLMIVCVLTEGEEALIHCDDEFTIVQDVVISDLTKRLDPKEMEMLLPLFEKWAIPEKDEKPAFVPEPVMEEVEPPVAPPAPPMEALKAEEPAAVEVAEVSPVIEEIPAAEAVAVAENVTAEEEENTPETSEVSPEPVKAEKKERRKLFKKIKDSDKREEAVPVEEAVVESLTPEPVPVPEVPVEAAEAVPEPVPEPQTVAVEVEVSAEESVPLEMEIEVNPDFDALLELSDLPPLAMPTKEEILAVAARDEDEGEMEKFYLSTAAKMLLKRYMAD